MRDAETFELIPGCTVTIYQENRITNASGSALFNDIPESFILKVEKDLAFQLGPKQTVIYSDTTITVYLTSKIFDITIKLMDKNTLDEFWGVNVTLGTETKVTDDQGEVTFTVYEGNYEYLIDKLSWLQETGTITITSDTTINFYLTQILAYIKFWLKEGNAAPVNNAIVRINGDSLVTTSLGLAHFRQLPVSVNYNYRISKTGYYEETGELYLTRDTSLYITMEPWLSNTELFPDGKSVKLWPNPVRDFLHCTVPDICSEQTLRITDLIGTEVFNQKVDEKSFNINISNLPQGVYILSLYSLELQTTRLFVKE